MKSNYYYTILLLFICCFTTICKSQQLPSDQFNEAVKMVLEILDTTATNPCSQYSFYFNCQPMNDGSGLYTITQISINAGPVVNPMSTNYTVFKNLTVLYLESSIQTNQNIMNILPQLTNITEVTIGNQDQEIDSTLQMPPNLNSLTFTSISVPLPSWVFSSGILETLILNPVEGFSYPNQFAPSNYLKYMITVQAYYTGVFPNNTGAAFTNLNSLKITVLNALGDQNYVNQVFPTFSSLNSLEFLEIDFNGVDKVQEFDFEQSITSITSLSKLTIAGKGFINKDNSTVIDFSNNKNENGFSLLLYYSSTAFIGDCKTSCLLLPPGTSLTMGFILMNISKIDYSNITSVNINSNNLEQTLPVSTINFPRVNQFNVQYSTIIGTIPEEYCKFPFGALGLSSNMLEGDVPSCFLCYGGGNTGAFNILPNQFDNFDQNTASNCPTFKIDSYNKIVKTDGTTILTITGKDFGFSKPDKLPTPPKLKVSVESPILTITVSNTEMTIWFPQGVAYNGANLTFTQGFSFDSSIQYTFNYSYEEPVINGYTLATYSGEQAFVLNGTGFNYYLTNNVKFNQLKLLGDPNVPMIGGSLLDGVNNPLRYELIEGYPFTVSVEVGGQTSATVSFVLFKTVSLVDPTSKLLSYGGSLELLGSFSKATKDMVKVFIHGIQCNVTSVYPTNITFDYPESDQGIYQLNVKVGGHDLYSSVEYIFAEKPTTPSPTTPTTSTTSTSTTSKSSSDDDVSFSTKLSIPFTTTCFFILSILFLLL